MVIFTMALVDCWADITKYKSIFTTILIVQTKNCFSFVMV